MKRNQNYIPQYDERLFNMIAHDCDKFYADQRVKRRNELNRELFDLKDKPRRMPAEDKHIAELEIELQNIKSQIGRKAK